MRPGSPTSESPTLGSTRYMSSTPLSCARNASGLRHSPKVARKENGTLSMVSLPASILEKSRMSLTITSKESADDLTNCRYSRCSSESAVPKAISVMPMMPFIGVRISWLMLARKSLLLRLADSAASLASVSCVSSILWAVTSVRRQTVIPSGVRLLSWRSHKSPICISASPVPSRHWLSRLATHSSSAASVDSPGGWVL